MSDSEPVCWILPRGEPRRRAYVCTPVEDSLADRSPVLATLMESGGVAELPEGVSVSDMLAWSSMPSNSLALHDEDDLVLGLRVADKMCDKHAELFAKELAEKIRDVRSDGSGVQNVEDMQRVVLGLEGHLQHLVLQQLAGVDALTRVLADWPAALQLAYFDMLVATNSQGLAFGTFPESLSPQLQAHHLEATLAMLARVKPAPPGLQSLTISSPIATTTATTLLSQALLHHSSTLTSLTLTSLPSPQDLPSLPTTTLSAIAHLTRLSQLAVAFDGPLHPDSHTAAATIAALAATITALPALADFRLLDINTMTPRDAAAALQGRKRKLSRLSAGIHEAVEPPSLDPVIAALAACPALTSLTLSRSDLVGPVPPPCHGVRGAFSTLQQLVIGTRTPTLAVPVWVPSHTSTPLPTDTLPALTSLSFQCGRLALSMPALLDVTRSAQHAPQLRALSLDADSIPDDALRALRDTALPPLQHVAAFSVCLRTVTNAAESAGVVAAAAALTALTHLRIRLKCFYLEDEAEEDGADADAPAAAAAAPDAMLSPLSTLTRLCSLSVELEEYAGSEFEPAVPAIAAAPFSALTGLTALGLVFAHASMPATRLAPQVSALTGLRSLALDGLKCETAAAVRACIAPLRALTSLSLGVDDVNYALVRSIAEWAGGLPKLRDVSVEGPGYSEPGPRDDAEDSADEGSDAEDVRPRWFHGLLYLPSWGKYRFNVDCQIMPAVTVGRVRKQLEARGAVVHDHCSTVEF